MTEERSQSAVFELIARDLVGSGASFRFCARGRSMSPTIQDGDVLQVEPILNSPKLGDIVLFFREGRFTAHRIVGRIASNFVTRGDAGMETDGAIGREDILGKVVAKLSAQDGSLDPFGTRDRLRFFATRARRFAGRQLRRWSLLMLLSVGAMVAILDAAPAWAQGGGVALDNANSQSFHTGGTGCGGTSPTFTCSFNHTTNSVIGSTGLLLVGVSLNFKTNAPTVVNSVKYNGVTMTQAVVADNAGGDIRASIYYLKNPAVGTFPIEVSITKGGGTGNFVGVTLGAMTLYRVDLSFASLTSNQAIGSGTTASQNVVDGANGLVVDTLAAVGPQTVTPGTGQTQEWTAQSGTTGQDVTGSSSSAGGTGTVTMQENLSASAAWALAVVSVPSTNPTAVKVNSFRATGDSSEVALSWKTGAEVHNLGYNVYRDVGGAKTRLNPSLIAGSALLFRDALPQHGAKSYGWIDSSPLPSAVYWLEDVDLNGTRTMHGPVSVESATVAIQPVVSPSISSLSRVRMQAPGNVVLQPNAASHVLERTVRPKDVSSRAGNIGFQLAAKPGIKILVDHEGWYRVTQPQLVAAGLRPNANGSLLHLYAEGVEQPIRIVGGGGSFGPQSAIEFYGTAIDTPFSGQRVYWLVEQGNPGQRITAISAGDSTAPQSPFFTQTLELKPRTTYFAALLRDNTDNFFGALVSPTSDVETINVADLAGGEATLDISLQGVTSGQQHDVTVALNGSTLGDVTFTDQQVGSAEFAVPGGVLSNGANTITLTAQQGTNDLSLVDTITLSFAHTYTAESDLLKFTADAGQSIAVGGFVQPPSRLVDITDPLRPVQVRFSSVAQGGSYTLHSSVPWTTSGEHTLLALSDLQLGSPAGIVPHSPSRLHASQPGAEFVIVTAQQFNAQFQPLAALHNDEGTRSTVVNVGDIYDEFNFGEPSPFAVKAFLKTATSTWSSKPKYLVLGGDASLDPRNYLGFGFFDFVPTKIVPTMELKTASDDWFSDFNNTGFATIATGRIAARTRSDAQLMVSKIVGYATGSPATWNRNALIVADADDPGTSFTQEAQSVQGLLPSTINATDVFAGTLGTSAANQDLLDGINNGQLLVNYNGHGSVQVWANGGLFDDTMAAGLTNGNKLPFFVIMNCLNGFFHDVYTQSLAESLMLAPNGGAVAVWASSGLTNAEPQFQMNNTLMQTLFSQPLPALGDAVLTAKSGISDIDVRRTYILFGDPAMRLRLPGTK